MSMEQYTNDMQILSNVKLLKKELLESKLILILKLQRLKKRIEKCDNFIDHIADKYGEE